jgi:hypothetical protein
MPLLAKRLVNKERQQILAHRLFMLRTLEKIGGDRIAARKIGQNFVYSQPQFLMNNVGIGHGSKPSGAIPSCAVSAGVQPVKT